MDGDITTNRLAELPKQINEEHGKCIGAFRSGLQHAFRTGELLNEAKQLVEHGKWQQWIGDNCCFSERTARRYMRVSRKYPELSKTDTVADLTLTGALQELAVPKRQAPANFFNLPVVKEVLNNDKFRFTTAGLDIVGDPTYEEWREYGQKMRAVFQLLPSYVERFFADIDMEVHELGELFPMVTDRELKALARSIKGEGLYEPITLYEGKILDGKCRYEACKIANVMPAFKTFPDDFPNYEGDAFNFVISANLRRSHYTEDQRVAILLELEEAEEIKLT